MNKFVLLLMSCILASTSAHAAEAPTEWIDPATGHRIIRLSREPGTASLYFNLNPYTPDGKKLVVTTPEGIATIDLRTHALQSVVTGRVSVIGVGRKSGDVYYLRHDGDHTFICATNLETFATRQIAPLPPHASIASVNADETLLAGVTTDVRHGLWDSDGHRLTTGRTPAGWHPSSPPKGPDGRPLTFAEQKEVRLNARLEARVPMTLFTLNLKTGEIKTLLRSTDWLNHLQFSPTDPSLLLFCHEGPWHKVDRIWLIRTDGTGLTKVHTRTMNMEIAGHEFWSADGKTVWYDLQTPRGEDFWVAGYEVTTGHRTWYHLQRNEWSVHFNVSPDGRLFAGDGGDSEMVAHAPDGKWLWLFHPEPIPDVAGISAPNARDLITPGYFRAERLVNMRGHDYRLEPNVSFTPDMKWIIFRSNLFGPTQVFAVEVARAAPADPSATPSPSP